MFNLSPKPLPEEDTERMETLWRAFERNFLWAQRQREDVLHPTGCTMFSCKHSPVAKVRSKLDEIYQWEDFSRSNYGAPIEEIAWT